MTCTKLTRSFLAGGLLLLFGGASLAALDVEGPTALVNHPPDFEQAEQDISEIIAQGYIPIGLEVDAEEGLYVLYGEAPDITLERWFMYEFEDLSKLEDEITAAIDEGWIPLDISATGDAGLIVLFADMDIQIDGWRIHTDPAGAETVEDTLHAFREDGFSPWGLSYADGRIWHLFLDESELPEPRAVNIQTYPRSGEIIEEGMSDEMEEGWFPWALMMRSDPDAASIEYTPAGLHPGDGFEPQTELE